MTLPVESIVTATGATGRVFGRSLVVVEEGAKATVIERYASGDLIMRITQGAGAARDMLNTVAVSFGRDALTLAGLVTVMVLQDPIMSAICFLGGPFVVIALRRLSRAPWRGPRAASTAASAPRASRTANS